MDRARSEKVTIALALFALYFVWGSTYFGMRIALEGYPPFVMGALRFLVAGGLLFIGLRLRGVPSPTPKQWRNSALIGLLLLPLGNGLVAMAQQSVASSLAAVMVSSMPLWAALFAGLFGKWPAPREWVGLLLGLVGIVFLNLDGELHASVFGAVMLIISPMCWAFGSVISRKLDLPKGPMASAAQMLMGSAIFWVISVPQWARAHPTVRSTTALLLLAIFGSLIAFSAYQYLLVTVRPSVATSYAYVNPVVALVIGTTIGAEHITRNGFIGTAFVLAAVILVALKLEKKAAEVIPPAAAGEHP